MFAPMPSASVTMAVSAKPGAAAAYLDDPTGAGGPAGTAWFAGGPAYRVAWTGAAGLPNRATSTPRRWLRQVTALWPSGTSM